MPNRLLEADIGAFLIQDGERLDFDEHVRLEQVVDADQRDGRERLDAEE